MFDDARLSQWLDIVLVTTFDVTSWVVGTDDVSTPGVTLLDTATDAGGSLPDDLGEVTGAHGEAWVGVVVVLDFVVPSFNGAGVSVAQGQVFTVWTAGVGQSTGTVVVVGVVLGVGGQVIGPGHGWGVLVQRSLAVVGIDHF